MTTDEFKKILEEKTDDEKTAQFYLQILKKHFIPDWYSTSGFVSNWDINPEMVFEILRKYPQKRDFWKRIYEICRRNTWKPSKTLRQKPEKNAK